MAVPISIPRLGWSMEEGAFAGWLKQDGDMVQPGDAVFSLESDKATENIETLDAGILRIDPSGPRTGDMVAVGTVIAYLVQSGESAPFAAAAPAARNRASETVAVGSTDSAGGPAARRRARQIAAATGPAKPPDGVAAANIRPPQPGKSVAETPRISPRARRAAAELKIDWTQLQGSGKTGRIRERDVRAAVAAARRPPSPLSPTRRLIAERMLHSARSTAPVTLTSLVDASNLVNLRAQFRSAGDAAGPVPSVNDFFVKLAGVALVQHPYLSGRWQDGSVVSDGPIHIGIAVDTEAGLLVPVIRDVANLGLRQVSARSADLIERARRRALAAEDMRGATFTVSSLGSFGIDAFSPVINYPEIAILGVGRIHRQPAVTGDQVVIRDLVTLNLTFDHCAVDGAPAARFLQTLGKIVENPGPWLMP